MKTVGNGRIIKSNIKGKKRNLFLSARWRYVGTVGIDMLIFSLCVDGNDGSRSLLGRFTPAKEPRYSFKEEAGGGGGRASLEDLATGKICWHLPGFELRIVQSVE